MNTQNEVLVAFSYCGEHVKSKVGNVPPLEHLLCLIKCMDFINEGPTKYPLLVSATNFSIDHPWEEERILGWEVYKRAAVISTKNNPGHQLGACWTIRYAMEYASVMNYKYLFFTADDILFSNIDVVDKVINKMKTNDLGYLGARWGNSPITLSTQVFCVKIEDFVDVSKRKFIFNPVVFGGRGSILEEYMFDIVARNHIKHEVAPGICYTHTHHTDELLKLTRDELIRKANPGQY